MAYNSDSVTDRLSAVRAAIDRCLTSQEYGVNGRTQRMADLAALRAMERDLMRESQAASSSGGGLSVGSFSIP